MHTDTPLIKEMEERNERIFDADYTKLDILTLVNELDISEESKQNLQRRLEKFLELFGGGLGCLNNQKPALMKLKKGTKPHTQRYYSIPKAYYKPAKTEVNWMMGIGVLR